MTTEPNPPEPIEPPAAADPAGPAPQLPARQTAPIARRAESGRAQREQIAQLVTALADPEHPLYTRATGELLSLGDAAVPALGELLSPRHPWLAAYRAAETLGQIGDGRATSALIGALRHPNANVRWAAVGALAQLGDVRALLALRRVLNHDRGRTTWGESVAGAAQGALEQLRGQNILLRSADLLKTAVAIVAMIVALVVAWNIVGTLRTELGALGRDLSAAQAATQPPLIRTAQPRPTGAATPQSAATRVPVVTSAPAASGPAGTVLVTGNVRSLPSRELGQRVGVVSPGDEITFLAISADQLWYRVRLGTKRATGSQIISQDSSGWVLATIVSPPSGSLQVERIVIPTVTPTP